MKRSNTIFLTKQEAALLGINDPQNQDVYLKNEKVKLHSIDTYKDEIFLPKGSTKGHFYLSDPSIKDDELKTISFISNKAAKDSSLFAFNVIDKPYLKDAFNKTREYLISKGIWTQDILAWFLGNPKEQNWTEEQIKTLDQQCSEWLAEAAFDFDKFNGEINKFRLDNENLMFSEQRFNDIKSSLLSRLDVISILVYLKSLLTEADYRQELAKSNETFDFNSINLKYEEFLPFSFERTDYKLRRSMLSNSPQCDLDKLLWDSCPECYKTNIQYRDSISSYSNEELDESLLNVANNSSISRTIISELKPTDDTLLTAEEIANLEKEFYSAGPINYVEQYDNEDYEEAIEDIEHYEQGHLKVLNRHQAHEHEHEHTHQELELHTEQTQNNLNQEYEIQPISKFEVVETKNKVVDPTLNPIIDELNAIYKQHSTKETNFDLVEEIQDKPVDEVISDEVEFEFIHPSTLIKKANRTGSCSLHSESDIDPIVAQLLKLKAYKVCPSKKEDDLTKEEKKGLYYASILHPIPTQQEHQAWINRDDKIPLCYVDDHEDDEHSEHEQTHTNEVLVANSSCEMMCDSKQAKTCEMSSETQSSCESKQPEVCEMSCATEQVQTCEMNSETQSSCEMSCDTEKSCDSSQPKTCEMSSCESKQPQVCEMNSETQSCQMSCESETTCESKQAETCDMSCDMASQSESTCQTQSSCSSKQEDEKQEPSSDNEPTISKLMPTDDTLLSESEINNLEQEFYSVGDINYTEKYQHEDYEEAFEDIEHYEQGHQKVELRHQAHEIEEQTQSNVDYQPDDIDLKPYNDTDLNQEQINSLKTEFYAIDKQEDVQVEENTVSNKTETNDDITHLINDLDSSIHLEDESNQQPKKAKKWFWKKK
ncbi:hypothetical protein JM47_01280 [Ureaplasma diversum]|uniref:Uncharacterized protein n=1 Tax=Ureaplasma diversum TaxID=42094 RepID=A0A0C5RBJ2_9BACT|nr:hypothetical protein [Ureaplasma diversum]AJQ45251.1 hypothetical protein JM47_01280 [Ureaplasma diversum]